MKEITATPSTRRRRPEAVCHVCRSRRPKRGEVRSAGGRPRRWRRRRTALFRLPGQRQRPSSESRAFERAAKAAAATLSMGWYGVVVHEAAGARAGPDQAAGPGPRRPSAASDGPRRRVRAVPHSSDLVDGRGELYERCGRRTRHPSAVALPDGERARVEFVRSRGRRARAAALVGLRYYGRASDYMPADLLSDSLLY